MVSVQCIKVFAGVPGPETFSGWRPVWVMHSYVAPVCEGRKESNEGRRRRWKGLNLLPRCSSMTSLLPSVLLG